MSWWGKVVGGALGFMMGGPLGAVLGAAIGHNFDRGLDGVEDMTGGAAPGDQQRVQTAFFTATFAVMGALAKADGRVSREEIRLAEAVMDQMNLTPDLRKAAMNLFSEGKKADFPLDDVLEQFRRESHRRKNLLRMFLEIQIQAAFADGVVHDAERRLLVHIARLLGFSAEEYARLEAMIGAHRHYQPESAAGPTLEDAYAMLNIGADASDAEVKKAYRRLMNQHHPDKLVARGLPEEMIKVATEKTHEIRQAYEQIRDSRGMR